jgi:hypothetical protein
MRGPETYPVWGAGLGIPSSENIEDRDAHDRPRSLRLVMRSFENFPRELAEIIAVNRSKNSKLSWKELT